MKEVTTELSDLKLKFRKWRATNRDDTLTAEFQTLNSKPKSEAQQAELAKVLEKFVSEKAAFRSETTVQSTTKYFDSKTTKKTVYATYDDVCNKYHYDLFDASNDEKFAHILKAGYVTRTKISKKEINKLEGTPFPMAARFKYQWSGSHDVII
jgi:hypothetical protein